MNELSLYCSKKTFDVAKVLSVLLVYFCHLIEPFNNNFQFLIVSLFFFVSGYGLDITCSCSRVLLRLPRYIVAFFLLSFLYYFVYAQWFFPSAWYLLAYFTLMIIYRFFSRFFYNFFVSYFVLSWIYFSCGFEFCYWTTTFAFVYGVFVARYSRLLTWFSSFVLFLCGFLAFYFHQFIFLLLFIPLYVRVLLFISKISLFDFLSGFSFLVYPFFLTHCFVLGLFDATWTLGGSFMIYSSIYCFVFSVCVAYLLFRFVPIFSKKKFWIFQ